jgi:hypothetical protein
VSEWKRKSECSHCNSRYGETNKCSRRGCYSRHQSRLENRHLLKEEEIAQNMALRNVQYAHQDTEASWSFDGKYVLFLRDVGEEKSRLLQIHRLEVSTESSIPITEVEDFITEIHVSPYTHHVAYKIDGGNEKANIIVKNYVEGEEIITPGKGKKNFGGWHKSGIHYFQLLGVNEVKWKRCSFDIKSQQIIGEDNDVGYFPDMLGQIQGIPIVINQFAKFDNTIHEKNQPFAYITNHERQCRLREGYSNDDSTFCIQEFAQERVGEIVQFQIKGGKLTGKTVLSSDEIGQQIKIYEEHPRGEIHGFLIIDECIIINLNQDGHSELHRYFITEKRWERIDLSIIEKKIGECWIEGIDYNESSGILLTVSSFRRPQHLWKIDSETGELVRLTEPSEQLEIGNVKSKQFLAIDGIDMQYFEIEPFEVSSSTETIIFFHGGPTVQTTCKWDRVIASFLAEKYRVIAPNPRGGIGRGANYCGLDDGEKRLTLIENEIGPFVEKTNSEYGVPCIYGGSYGGWIVLTLATSPVWKKYIKASASRNGLVCMVTFFDGDNKREIKPTAKWRKGHREQEYLGDLQGGERKRLMEKLSPMRAEISILNNTIMIYGELDTRIPSAIVKPFMERFSITNNCPFKDDGHKIKRYPNRIEMIEDTLKLFRR